MLELIAFAVMAQPTLPCDLSPVQAAPQVLWSEVEPGTPPAAGDDSTNIVGLGVEERGERWLDAVATGNDTWPVATIGGKSFALRARHESGALAGEREPGKHIRVGLQQLCESEPPGEVDVFFEGGAADTNLQLVVLASESPKVGGLTVWEVAAQPRPIYRLEGIGCAAVDVAGGYAVCAAPRGAWPGGLHVVDLQTVVDCDSRCATQKTCPNSLHEVFGPSTASAVAALFVDGLAYAAVPEGAGIAVYGLPVARGERPVLEMLAPQTFALDLVLAADGPRLAAWSSGRLAVWSLDLQRGRSFQVWSGPTPGRGEPAVRWLSDRFLWASSVDVTCEPLGTAVLLDSHRAWRPIAGSRYWGWYNRFRVHQALPPLLFDTDLYWPGYSSLTHHRIRIANDEIFTDDFETGTAAAWSRR